MNEEIELGDKVKDLISGFEGIAVAKTVFINGCVQFSIAQQLKKGQTLPVEGAPSIDSVSLRVLKKDAVGLKKKEEKAEIPRGRTGGPTKFMKPMRGY
jgi:hypothetical protein